MCPVGPHVGFGILGRCVCFAELAQSRAMGASVASFATVVFLYATTGTGFIFCLVSVV